MRIFLASTDAAWRILQQPHLTGRLYVKDLRSPMFDAVKESFIVSLNRVLPTTGIWIPSAAEHLAYCYTLAQAPTFTSAIFGRMGLRSLHACQQKGFRPVALFHPRSSSNDMSPHQISLGPADSYFHDVLFHQTVCSSIPRALKAFLMGPLLTFILQKKGLNLDPLCEMILDFGFRDLEEPDLYPFQNRIQVSNRGGSIFLICDQSDLEAGFHFGTGIIAIYEGQANPIAPFQDDCIVPPNTLPDAFAKHQQDFIAYLHRLPESWILFDRPAPEFVAALRYPGA